MLLHIFYYLPAILGVLFIAVGTYHGWKFRGMTRRCKGRQSGPSSMARFLSMPPRSLSLRD